MATTTTTGVATTAIDLKRNDVFEFRTHKGAYLFTVISVIRVEGEWGMLHLAVSRPGHGIHTFRTNATDKFSVVS